MRCPLCGGLVRVRRRAKTVALDCELCSAFCLHQHPDPAHPGSALVLAELDFAAGVVKVPADLPGSNVVRVLLSDGREFKVRIRNGVLSGYPKGQAVQTGRWLKAENQNAV